jgi:hypothetical protein
MKLGLVVYLTFVCTTAEAGPVQIVAAPNEDLVAQVHGISGLRIDEIALEVEHLRPVRSCRRTARRTPTS